jgi:hypothetical protein
MSTSYQAAAHMKILNFELSLPYHCIELRGLDFVWDLHNAGTFLGLTLNANDNTASMKWRVSGAPSTIFPGCELSFVGLKLLIISARDEDLRYSEDLTISGISKVTPGSAEKWEYRVRREWNSSDPFHLLFDFQSQRSIEIDADTVELIGWSVLDLQQ